MLDCVKVGKKFISPNRRNKHYKYAVRDFNYCFKENKIYALVGESGCGKSTLATMLSGIASPSEGRVQLNGVDVHTALNKDRKKFVKKLQIVLQNSAEALNPAYSIKNILHFPMKNILNLTHDARKEKTLKMLDYIGLDESILYRKAHELSGGQQKRVCLALALLPAPELIIFDEAMAGLDLMVKNKILLLLKQIQKDYCSTFIFITHDMKDAMYLADKVLVMKAGQLIAEEDIRGIEEGNCHDYTKKLFKAGL